MAKGRLCLIALTLCAAPVTAAPVAVTTAYPAPRPAAPSVQKALEAQILSLEKQIHGRIGVAFRLLETGESAAVNEARYPMASTYKVAIAGTVLAKIDRGEASLDQMITVTQRDVDQTGEVANRLIHPGVTLSVANLMELMLTQSNNTATDKMIALAGGPAAVTAWLKSIGVTGVRVDRSVNDLLDSFFHVPEGSPFTKVMQDRGLSDEAVDAMSMAPNPGFDDDPRDTAVPSAMVDLLAKELTTPLLKESSRVFLAGVMERCETGAGRLKGMLPAGTVIAHKTGTIARILNDVGMITLPEGRGPLLIAVYTKESDLPEPNREHAIAEIARTAFDYFTMR